MLAAPPHSLLDGASLFLDFDGTLVELADRPDRVVIGPDLRPLLLDLRDALEGRLAIVSGRSVATLRMAFGLSDFLLSGSHGLEHARPGQSAEAMRSEEHTPELQSLMRISYAVFCLKKKKTISRQTTQH